MRRMSDTARQTYTDRRNAQRERQQERRAARAVKYGHTAAVRVIY